MNRKTRRKIRKIRRLTVLVLALTVVTLVATVGGTIAYLATNTDALVNTFTPGEVITTVNETLNGNTKSNVSIKNSGNTSAYIRAAVVANWYEDGKIVAPWTATIKLSSANWFKGNDGYYYYKTAVPAGGSTANLFDSYTAKGGPEGAHLEMTIICQGVQSSPAAAVQEAWGVSVASDGSISK